MSAPPLIRTTVVGSYPIPEWLGARPSEQALIDATRVVIDTQEQAGIDLVCDGELYRFDVNHPETNGMIEYFVRDLGGVRRADRFEDAVAFRQQAGMAFRTRPAGVIDGPLDSGTLHLAAAAARAKRLASKPLKFTLTGPHMLAKTLVDRHYGSVEAVADALAGVLAEQVRDIDADVVQLDEANLPGHPEEWEWAVRAVNRVLDAIPTTAALHLCFGNYGGQTIQRGRWNDLLRFLDALHVDHVVLEMEDRPEDELRAIAELRHEIGIGLGVVDVKSTRVESAEHIARRIERAEAVLGAGRVRYIHPDCGFWMLHRSIADAKIAALVAGRDLYEGRVAAVR